MSRNILVLNGHPRSKSLTGELAKAYLKGAENAGHEVRFISLSDMQFDMDFGEATYKNSKALEPDLESFMQSLEWADHFVIASPLWWGFIPAKLKGLFDRAFLPGRTFDTKNRNKLGVPAPMLTGKTARVLLCSDTPNWALRIFYSNAIKKILSRQILGFVGIKPTKFTVFAPASEADGAKVEVWLNEVKKLGMQAK